MYSLHSTLLWIFLQLFVLHAVVFSIHLFFLITFSIEFGHHVKNVSLASFTEDEVNRILSGGNRVDYLSDILYRNVQQSIYDPIIQKKLLVQIQQIEFKSINS